MNSDEKISKDIIAELHCPPTEIRTQFIDRSELNQDAKERSKQQPILQRIIKSLSKNDKKYREVLIAKEGLETRVVMLLDGVLETFEVEHVDDNNLVGAIFKGRIQNLEPGLKAAFVITGQEKNAFLHYWDMIPAANDAFEMIGPSSQSSRISLDDIPAMYPVGTEIMVQVTKDQIGSKGPRVTTNIALPGRYLVLTPFNDQCGISRKIESAKERNRLREILKQLAIPQGMGIVIRTVGEGKKLKYFVRDLSILLREWNDIATRADQSDEPALIYREPDLLGRAVRDFLTEDIDRIVTDSEEIYHRIVKDINDFAPRMRSRIHLYSEAEPIFEHFHVEKQILETFSKRVPLSSGGEIVIEETEALTSIDVNTGGHKMQHDGGNFILQVNQQAALEIARQIRLRNLGGLIIIDFIDMKSKGDQRKIYETMTDLMEQDAAKFQILPISAMGVMQMTRQRHSQSIARDMRSSCPYCEGRGTIKSVRTMATEIQRTLCRLLKRMEPKPIEPRGVDIFLHPETLNFIKNCMEPILRRMETESNVIFTFYAEPMIHHENFKICDAVTKAALI